MLLRISLPRPFLNSKAGSAGKVGTIPPEDSILRLTPKEGLAQALDLSVLKCHELSALGRRMQLTGDVVMEVFIQSDGKVSAARALRGQPVLANDTLQAAMRWRFTPIPDSNKIRRTGLTIRYKKEWVRFPWIK